MGPKQKFPGMVGFVNLTPTTAGIKLDCGGEEECHLNRTEARILKFALEDIIDKGLAERAREAKEKAAQ